MPQIIEKLEQQQANFESEMAHPDFYQDAKLSADKLTQFELLKSELEQVYSDWDELEAQKEE